MNMYGDNVRYYRERLGLSQTELARRLGYKNYSSVYKAEKGLLEISPAKLRRYAEALGVTVEQLQGEEVPPTATPSNPILAVLMQCIPRMSDAQLIRLTAYAQELLGDTPRGDGSNRQE